MKEWEGEPDGGQELMDARGDDVLQRVCQMVLLELRGDVPLHGESRGLGGVGKGCRDPVFSGVVGGGFEVVYEGRGFPPGIVASGRRGGGGAWHSRGVKGSWVEHVPIPLKSVEFDAPALARFDSSAQEGGFGSDPVRSYLSLPCHVEVGVGRFGEGPVWEMANALESFEFEI